MEKDYTRRRLDRIADDVAVTRSKIEAIERHLYTSHQEYRQQTERLNRLERRVYAIWIVGPALLSGVVLLQGVRSWLTSH